MTAGAIEGAKWTADAILLTKNNVNVHATYISVAAGTPQCVGTTSPASAREKHIFDNLSIKICLVILCECSTRGLLLDNFCLFLININNF